MSRFEQGKDGPMANVDQSHDISGIEHEKNISQPTRGTGTDQLTKNQNAEKESEEKGPYLQRTEPLPDLAQSKSAETTDLGDEEAPESDLAHIGRLGRERPAKFKSFGAELAFCYSVIASQFMSVRIVAALFVEGEI